MKQPAPRYYIEGKTVSLLIGRLISGKPIRKTHPSTLRMAERLKDDYLEYLREHPDNTMPRSWVMDILVERPAPEFFLGWRSIMYILEREIRKVRSKWDA